MKETILYVVVPCYNEEACLKETSRLLKNKLASLVKTGVISKNSKIVFVDDGSKDATWKIIEGLDGPIVGVKLAHNRGHQNALLAGLMYAKERADAIISMDADLQDDIEAMDKFLQKFREENCEIVYGVRSERKTDTAFKRNTALAFYKIMRKLGAETVYNHADYRLMSKRALDELSGYQEVNLFLRGIIPTIGLKTAEVKYVRNERFAGESKYPLKKMMGFAWDGITSFSVKPIRIILAVGIIVSVISLLVLLYALIVNMLGQAVSGWTFIICSIWLLGGIQMFSIGLIGEYVGKIYAETKRRPRYIIEKIVERNKPL
ncbi:glycosyltransferase family 2 protein [Candidatus Saccharibacteria bacterium]|nr:glycosyltransferase family 2 protein [Candidatus Saccharibacteria bacterium]